MTVYKVNSNGGLQDALRSAKGGDEIQLSGSGYSLSMRNLSYSSEVTITSASGSNPAEFSKIELTNARNITFDGIDLVAKGSGKPFVVRESSNITVRDALLDGETQGGYGTGRGLHIAFTDNFTLENSVVRDFYTGGYFLSDENLTIRNNSFDNISLDAMILGRVRGVLIDDNVIEMNVKNGTKHTDGIQLWNTGSNDPARNVTITDNYIATNGTESHGIYAANGLGKSSGSFFQDFTIKGNTVVSAQMSAIAIGEIDGLDIIGNTVLQDPQFRSSSEIRTPAIHVMGGSKDVTIRDNVTHDIPAATGSNWQPLKSGSPGAWDISNNKIVSIGTSVKNAPSAPGKSDAPSKAPPVAPDTDSGSGSGSGSGGSVGGGSSSGGNGRADTFRLDGDSVPKTPSVLSGFDFGDKDKIVLIDYANGTFKGQGGGNKLDVSSDGTYVKIDALADLQELESKSAAVDILRGANDTLIIEVAQKGQPDHLIHLAGYADDYFG